MEVWFVVALVLVGIVGYFALMFYLGALRQQRHRQRKDERRHAEQLEWRRSGRLPVRYETVYRRGEPVDEDVARMEELGFYVADDAYLADGSRRVIYRRGDVSAL